MQAEAPGRLGNQESSGPALSQVGRSHMLHTQRPLGGVDPVPCYESGRQPLWSRRHKQATRGEGLQQGWPTWKCMCEPLSGNIWREPEWDHVGEK